MLDKSLSVQTGDRLPWLHQVLLNELNAVLVDHGDRRLLIRLNVLFHNLVKILADGRQLPDNYKVHYVDNQDVAQTRENVRKHCEYFHGVSTVVAFKDIQNHNQSFRVQLIRLTVYE